ncbi:MAG: AAA family ATPase [Syntrophales bacterium]|jgi:hypothetical protein
MNKVLIQQHFKDNYHLFYERYLKGNTKKNGNNQYIALCPLHDDKNPSFSFNAKTGQYFCHGCNKKGDMIRFYADLKGLDDRRDFSQILKGIAGDFRIPDSKKDHPKLKEVKAYTYRDKDSKTLFQVVRFIPKTFRQRQPDHANPGKWIWDIEGVRLVPYRLPELLKAKEIIIVEGEKDADNVIDSGFTATTSPMGAKKWRSEYSEYFRGKNVVLIPDNDDEGREHMTQIASALMDIAATIKWLDLPGLPIKGDVSDFINTFTTKEESFERLSIMIESAPLYAPPKTLTIDSIILDAENFIAVSLPPKRSLIHPILSENQIIMITGWRGVGKTWAAMSMADAITRRGSFGPWQVVESVPCLYLDGEMAAQDIQGRLNLLNPKRERRENPLLIYSDAYANFMGLRRANLVDETWRADMKRILTALNIKVFFIDNIASLAPEINENDKKDWDPINRWLIDLRFSGITTLFLHHMNKEKGQRGTSAHEDNIDMSITLDRPLDYQPENGADFILSFSKARVPYEDLTHLQQTHFTLKPDRDGHMIWEHSNVKAETKNAVLQMLDQGFSPKDIMAALSISKGRITQIKQDAIKKGIMTREGKIIGSNF